ncbi:MAG: hypothetical protein AB7C95_00805 [Synergistaceae bacterium]
MPKPRPKITEHDAEKFLTLLEWAREDIVSIAAVFKAARVPASSPTWIKSLREMGLIYKDEKAGGYRVDEKARPLPEYVDALYKHWHKPPKKPVPPVKPKKEEAPVLSIGLERRLEGIENTLVRLAGRLDTMAKAVNDMAEHLADVPMNSAGAEEVAYVNNAILAHLLFNLGEASTFMEQTAAGAIRRDNRVKAEPNALGVLHDQLTTRLTERTHK